MLFILLLYMADLGMQIYLTADQRRNLDAIAKQEGASLAELIRLAVDEYLDSRSIDVDSVLAETFGAVTDATASSREEWRCREAQVSG